MDIFFRQQPTGLSKKNQGEVMQTNVFCFYKVSLMYFPDIKQSLRFGILLLYYLAGTDD
jgi:hypothetical protein